MRISRQLAHRLNGRLQEIMSAIEMRSSADAIAAVHDLSQLIDSLVETRKEERERTEREELDRNARNNKSS